MKQGEHAQQSGGNAGPSNEGSGGASGLPSRLGEYYLDTVPDTLDLAERGQLGIGHFTSLLEERLGYEMPIMAHLAVGRPPFMQYILNDIGTCQPKALEAMAFLRLMTGSKVGLDKESRMVEMMALMLGDDGLYWVPGSPDKTWLGIPEPFAAVHGQGRMLRAMIAWYQYTGDPAWKRRIDRMVEGLDKVLSVHKDDYAYFPNHGFYDEEYLRSCFTHKGWKDQIEPKNEKAGEEGSLFNHQGHMPGALATWYQLTGNEQSLRLSGELVRFLTKPKFWADISTLTPADLAAYAPWQQFPAISGPEYPAVIGAEHAHWQGHIHGHINTLRALLEYALATDDERLKAFVRDGYEWTRQEGFIRIGYIGDGQGCGLGRLIGLAVKLSNAGVGDYWEDIDQYIRNQGTEMQIMPDDREYMESLSVGKPPPPKTYALPGDVRNTDHVIDKVIGGFGGHIIKDSVWLCCSPHGNMGLFYAWDGGLRYDEGTARVNLLLNRASPWVDIYSYIPYEGKVILKNKESREVLVRMPLWIDRQQLQVRVGSSPVANVWLGNYIRLRDLKPRDVVTIEFPMRESTEKWTVRKLHRFLKGPEEEVCTCRFKGNTLVEMSPDLFGSPLYKGRAKQYQISKAPMRQVTRFVTPKVLTW